MGRCGVCLIVLWFKMNIVFVELGRLIRDLGYLVYVLFIACLVLFVFWICLGFVTFSGLRLVYI